MAGPAEQLRAAVGNLRVHRHGDHRAPHKPLLILLALGRVARGEPRLVPFAEVEDELAELLRDFGSSSTPRPAYPFWRLQTDEIWEVSGELRPGASGDPPLGELRRVRGGFPAALDDALRADPDLVAELTALLLEAELPPSRHDELLERIGLADLPVRRRPRRDRRFRLAVLRAYAYRCAVCGYDGHLDRDPLGLDAAHVRWHAYAGSDTVDNGLALCSLHHVALDKGAIGFDDRRRLMVSEAFHGSGEARRRIGALAGVELARPQAGRPALALEHVRWHAREVFRGREVASALAAERGEPFDA